MENESDFSKKIKKLKRIPNRSCNETFCIPIIIVVPTFLTYIDPSTGGLIFQGLAVIFAAISGFILMFSSRIKIIFFRMVRFFREFRSRKKSSRIIRSGENK